MQLEVLVREASELAMGPATAMAHEAEVGRVILEKAVERDFVPIRRSKVSVDQRWEA